MKKAMIAVVVLLMALLLVGCCSHEWQEATCERAKTCTLCGESKGEPLGHDWQEATCDAPKTCARCGETEGEALGHEAGEWEIRETSEDTVRLVDRSVLCVRCGETMEDGWVYTPAYEDGVFTFSANAFAGFIEGDWGEEASAQTDDDGAVYVLLTVDGEEAAKVYFLDSDGSEITGVDVDEPLCAETVVTVVTADSNEVRDRVLPMAIRSCLNEEMTVDSDAYSDCVESVMGICSLAQIYSTEDVSCFWGQYDGQGAMYIGLGDVQPLYDEHVTMPYFDFGFAEFIEAFNSNSENIALEYEIRESGTYSCYGLYYEGTEIALVLNMDYVEEEGFVVGPEKKTHFNRLVVEMLESTGDQSTDFKAALVFGSHMAPAADESVGSVSDFLNAMMADSEVKKIYGLTSIGGYPASVYENNGLRYWMTASDAGGCFGIDVIYE